MDQDRLYRVLVVDDDEIDRLAVAKGLANSGLDVEVKEAHSGEEGLQLLDANSFDCVFLDYRMGPGADGLETVKQARQAGKTIPVIIMTGYGDERIAVKLMKAGATDYLPKATLTPEVLGRSLRGAVALWETAEKHRQAEIALQESEESFRSIFNSAHDAMIIFSPDTTRIVKINPRTFDLLGYKPDDLDDLYAGAIFPDNLATLVEIARPRPEHDGHRIRETVCAHRDGHKLPVEVSISPLSMGQHPMLLALIRDISRRKQLESEREISLLNAIEANRLASIGELAGGIAHEINQPLQSFKLTLFNLARSMASDALNPEIATRKIEKMQTLADEITNIVKNLQGYAASDEGCQQNNLPELFDSVLAMVRPQLKQNQVAIETNIPEDLQLWCYRNALAQALLNILRNALEAFARQPAANGDQRRITIVAHSEGDRVTISITDNAGGIPQPLRQRVFEPFVSTKPAVKGIGMGLHIVRQIILEHKGEIDLQVEDGVGTSVEMRLPVHDSTLLPAETGKETKEETIP